MRCERLLHQDSGVFYFFNLEFTLFEQQKREASMSFGNLTFALGSVGEVLALHFHIWESLRLPDGIPFCIF